MQITMTLNGKKIKDNIDADMLLIDFLRDHRCFSVKRGCETSNCGLCTVFMDEKPVLSCSVLAVRADGHDIRTLEGLQDEAAGFIGFIADQGADQCGFCNPGSVSYTHLDVYKRQAVSGTEPIAFRSCGLCDRDQRHCRILSRSGEKRACGPGGLKRYAAEYHTWIHTYSHMHFSDALVPVDVH